MEERELNRIVLLILALLIVVIAVFICQEKSLQVKFSPTNWHALNNGNAIDFGNPDIIGNGYSYLFFQSVATDNALYYFFKDRYMYNVLYSGRLNLINKNWEIWTDDGWSADENNIPKPISLIESVGYAFNFKFFSSPAAELFGMIKAIPRSLATPVDFHGLAYSFKIDENGITKWGGSNFGDFQARGFFPSWQGSYVDMAVDEENGNAIMVGSYGNYPFGTPTKIAAAKYFAAEDKWKTWTSSGWSTSTSFVPVPNSAMGGDFTEPKITHIPNTEKYLLIFSEEISYTGTKYCATLYDDNDNSWKWWNGYAWTNQGTYTCYNIASGISESSIYSLIGRDNGEVSIIFSSYLYPGVSSLYEIVYNSAAEQISPPNLFAENIPGNFIFAKDNSDKLWFLYSKDTNQIFKREKQASWSDEEILFEYPGENADVIGLNFFQDNTPVVFVYTKTSKKVYAYSNAVINDIPNAWALGKEPVIKSDNNIVEFMNKWKNMQDDACLHAESFVSPGHMALDNEGNLYVPKFTVNEIIIHTAETDDPSDGYNWGQPFIFRVPTSVAVDNIREKVYVLDDFCHDYYYTGRLQIFPKSLNQQSFCSIPSGVSVPAISSGFMYAIDLTIDEENGYLYVSDAGNNRIRKYDVINLQDEKPTLITDIGTRGQGNGQFEFPQAIDVDVNGDLYVADAENHRIQVFDKNGNYLRKFGDYGPGTGQMLYPYGLAVDKDLNLVYITDPYNKNFQIYSKAGEFLYSFNNWEDNINKKIFIGIVAYGNGVIGVGVDGNIVKFSIADLTDNNVNEIPDVLENICLSDGCNQHCSPNCGHEEDPDCGISTCNDNCKNGDETGTDCGGSCFSGETENICNDGIDNDRDCLSDCYDWDCEGLEGCACINWQIRECDDIGECQSEQFCVNGEWGVCVRTINPKEEICDGFLDENCDGNIDEGCVCVGGETRQCGIDVGECEYGIQQCLVGLWGECQGGISPVSEICDGKDNNCNGQIDEGVKLTYYQDLDADNYGNPNILQQACSQPSGYVGNNRDCNDNDININPSAIEILGDSIDNDCDGQVDEGADPVSCMADFDENGQVDWSDFNFLVARYGLAGCGYTGNIILDWCEGADLNRDGKVDEVLDWNFFNSNWGVCDCSLGPELCDGYDNDCDNVVDEGCDCINLQRGVCDDGNQKTCENGKWIGCVSYPSPSSGGGSSGGVSSTVKIYTLTETQIITGATENLGTNDKFQFTVQGASHSVKLTKVTTKSATMTIASTPQTITLTIGEEKKIDLDNNGYYDLYVKLNSIKSGKADVTIKSIYEKISGAVPETSLPEEETESKEEIPLKEENKDKGYIKFIVIGILSAVIIIVIISLLIIRNRRKKKH